jgi:putative transposase
MSASCAARQGIAQQWPERGISSATFYKYKSKYGGMEPCDAKRLRALEDENGKLKKLLVEQMLERDLVRHWSEDNGRAPCCETSIRKNGDACCKAGSGGSLVRSARCEPTAGV